MFAYDALIAARRADKKLRSIMLSPDKEIQKALPMLKLDKVSSLRKDFERGRIAKRNEIVSNARKDSQQIIEKYRDDPIMLLSLAVAAIHAVEASL